MLKLSRTLACSAALLVFSWNFGSYNAATRPAAACAGSPKGYFVEAIKNISDALRTNLLKIYKGADAEVMAKGAVSPVVGKVVTAPETVAPIANQQASIGQVPRVIAPTGKLQPEGDVVASPPAAGAGAATQIAGQQPAAATGTEAIALTAKQQPADVTGAVASSVKQQLAKGTEEVPPSTKQQSDVMAGKDAPIAKQQAADVKDAPAQIDKQQPSEVAESVASTAKQQPSVSPPVTQVDQTQAQLVAQPSTPQETATEAPATTAEQATSTAPEAQADVTEPLKQPAAAAGPIVKPNGTWQMSKGKVRVPGKLAGLVGTKARLGDKNVVGVIDKVATASDKEKMKVSGKLSQLMSIGMKAPPSSG